MIDILVIADDLTGANDTGALLSKNGFDAVTAPYLEEEAWIYENKNVLCINIDSRAASGQTAYERVLQTVKTHKGEQMLLSKRIDSTMRGNVGKEIDGALDGLPWGYKAIVVAALPASGRICAGGYLLVHGIPLELSGAAEDPKTPVRQSRIDSMIREQSRYEVCHIGLEEVLLGEEYLRNVIANIQESVLVIDAVTEDNIKVIAAASVNSGIPFFCADPGDFTLWTAKFKFQRNEDANRRSLLVIGSLGEVTKKQLEYLMKAQNTLVYMVDMDQLLRNECEEAKRALDLFTQSRKPYQYLCITTIFSKRLPPLLDPGENTKRAEQISSSIAGIATSVLSGLKETMEFVYLCGGDIAKDFLGCVKAKGIDIIEEVIPLAVHGKLIGGLYDGLHILTKGGMIGNDDSLAYMLSYLTENKNKGVSL